MRRKKKQNIIINATRWLEIIFKPLKMGKNELIVLLLTTNRMSQRQSTMSVE